MLKVINPYNQEVVGEYQVDTPQTLSKKYEAAAGHNWRSNSYEFRASTLEKFGKLLGENVERCAKLLSNETGKPISQARNEVNGVQARLDFFLSHTKELVQTETVLSDEQQGLTEQISYEPLGVIGNISAWNYPYFVGCNVFIPALLTGNAVMYKPSEFCVGTGLLIAELLYKSGVPEEVFSVVVGGGDVGSTLLNLPLGGVFFTGSNATGKKIAAKMAARMVPLQMELGGKDPVYVCDDVDVKVAAAATADGAFYNVGQGCCSVERIYVHEKVYDQFVDEFVEVVKGFKAGDPAEDDTYIGPLTRSQQLDVLADQVEDAKSKGAKVLTGGKKSSQAGFFEPTVLVDVDHTMKVMRDESFGPIIGIMKVDGDDQAVEHMNNTEYGLTSGVYSKDGERAEKILAHIQSGSVYWNCCDRISPFLPWSGRKSSGIGSTLSKYGILAFVNVKAWHKRKA